MSTATGTQPHLRPHAKWLATGLCIVVIIAAAATLWATGADPVAGLADYARTLPLTVQIGAPAGLLFLAVAAPSGVWEWRRFARIRLARRRRERIQQLSRLAELLHLTPQTLDETTPKTLRALNDKQFEEAMCELLRAQGYRNVKVTGQAGDHGIDLVGLTPDGKRVIVGQCKRWEDRGVSEPDIREFLGASYHHMVLERTQAQVGLFLATSYYTEPAVAFARQHRDPVKRSQVSLHLFDGEQIAEEIRKLAVN